ncbi:MAG: hypothetical protein J7J76_02720 [Candidatus Latescibacteria bacterium]|nr:hypothetical protein [Candidatus Latescibacterota bacterium]
MRSIRWILSVAMIAVVAMGSTGALGSEVHPLGVRPLEANYSLANAVPISKVKALAEDHARNIWGSVTQGPIFPLCDLRGDILVYEVVFSLSEEPFLKDMQIIAEFDQAKSLQKLAREKRDAALLDSANKARWGVGRYVTMVIGARYDVFPVLEYHTGLPPYYTVLDDAKAKASTYLGVKNPRLTRLYAAGYLDK